MNPKAKAARGGMWIGEALKDAVPGALHKQLGVALGKKIPMPKLQSAAKKGDTKMAKRARLAMTLRSFK